jgi:3'-5' exoribonuclease
MRFISELKEGEHISESYYCSQKQLLKTKTGKKYISLILLDKTGTINGKIWDIDEENIGDFNQGDVIEIEGFIKTFSNSLQINIEKLRKIIKYNIENYVRTTGKNIDVLEEQLWNFIESINNIYLQRLLQLIFKDQDIIKRFKKCSAGKSMHHNYVGGLIEHTISVTEICDFMSKRTAMIDRDILIASAILHDIGKIYELSDFPDNSYTDDGELIGHISIAAVFISQKMDDTKEFPKYIRSNVIHCILSHHGEYEFGSPKLPKTMEALVLHFADNLDAKTKMFEEIIKSDTSDSNFTSYNKILDRKLFKPTSS